LARRSCGKTVRHRRIWARTISGNIPKAPVVMSNMGRLSWIIAGSIVCSGLLAAQDLRRGRFEIRARGGINNTRFGTAPAVWVEGAFGLSKSVASTGTYVHDYLNDDTIRFCVVSFFILPGQQIGQCTAAPSGTRRIHEFMGGLRLSLPNRSKFTPFVHASLGAV